MKPSRRAPLRLEQLENRFCPSLTLTYLSGSLTITGTPAGAGTLLIQGTTGNNFTITDDGKGLGTRLITGNLTLNLTNHQGESIDIDLNGNSIPGNLSINLGAGDNHGDPFYGTGIYNSGAAGQIGGSLTIQGGSGAEIYEIGYKTPATDPGNGTPTSLRVGGNIQVTGKESGTPRSALSVQFNELVTTNSVTGDSTVSVGGAMQIATVDATFLGAATTISKGLTVSAAGARPLIFLTSGADSSGPGTLVNGGFTFTGSTTTGVLPAAALPGNGDFVDLDGIINGGAQINAPTPGSATITLDSIANGNASNSVITGTTTITAANGAAQINLTSIVNGATTINTGSNSTVTLSGTQNGNTTLSTTGSNNSLSVAAGSNVFGNLSFNLGSGPDTVSVAATAAVFGNLTVSQSGNGNESITLAGTESGYLRITLGNGNDSVSVTNAPTGIFYLTTGNGNSSITLNGSGDNWNVNFNLGNGNDTLNLAGTASTIMGRLQAGSGSDTIINGPPAWTDNTYYENF